MRKKHLIVDMSNILYRVFFAHIKDDFELNVATCHHVALQSVNKYFTAIKPDELVLTFDDYSWRKAYTEDLSECVTFKKYKGNRRTKLSDSDKAKIEQFDSHLEEFVNLFKTQTRVIVLRRKWLEADDLIAGYIQEHGDDEHVLISGDKDFMQLLVRNNLTLIDPDTGKERTLEEFDNDPDYFMFIKCIRGDAGDNVISAYPRIRKTKLKEAYRDPLLLTNIMKNEFTALVNNEDGTVTEKELVTEDVFMENVLLMDLTAQPDHIKALIQKEIKRGIEERGKFNYMEFLRFCGKYDLIRIRDSIDSFVPMLSCKAKRF